MITTVFACVRLGICLFMMFGMPVVLAVANANYYAEEHEDDPEDTHL